jgi:hypothetical protein
MRIEDSPCLAGRTSPVVPRGIAACIAPGGTIAGREGRRQGAPRALNTARVDRCAGGSGPARVSRPRGVPGRGRSSATPGDVANPRESNTYPCQRAPLSTLSLGNSGWHRPADSRDPHTVCRPMITGIRRRSRRRHSGRHNSGCIGPGCRGPREGQTPGWPGRSRSARGCMYGGPASRRRRRRSRRKGP